MARQYGENETRFEASRERRSEVQVDVKSLCAGILLGMALVLAMGTLHGAQKHEVTVVLKGDYTSAKYPIRIDMN
jgi:hypothetical protein